MPNFRQTLGSITQSMYIPNQISQKSNLEFNCSGCSDQEIKSKELELGITFPEAFKEFLMICGKNTGTLFCGDNVSLDSYNYINEGGKENYKEAFGKEPKKEVIFILEHHGYSFYYFELGTGENPDLFLLVNGDEVLHEKFGKFSDLMATAVKNVT